MKAKEFIAETKKVEKLKPRNFVAKNAVQSGAGAHKDQKKAQKQGDFKHKKDAVPMEDTVTEKAVSKKQQRFMGMVHAMQKGEKVKGASKELKAAAKSMSKKDAKDFAKTKHKGLPEKKVSEESNGTDLETRIAELEKREGQLEMAVKKAREITKEIKYVDVHSSILAQIEKLAEEVGIDASELKYAAQEVSEKFSELQSSIYALDDVFTDAYRSVDSELSELKWELDDMQRESIRSSE